MLTVKVPDAAEPKVFPIVDVPGIRRFRAKLLDDYGERVRLLRSLYPCSPCFVLPPPRARPRVSSKLLSISFSCSIFIFT